MNAQSHARKAGLRYYPDSEPGIRRQPRGRGFSYIAPDGTTIADRQERRRIESLAVPPAYTDVWISPINLGHVVATGRDQAGRKQHRYHELWSLYMANIKFAELREFGEALSRIRRWIAAKLARDRTDEMTATACILALMDRMSLRVGSRVYSRENGSFAATTLKPDHLLKDDGRWVLKYPAKGGSLVRKPVIGKRLLHHLSNTEARTLVGWTDASGQHRSVTPGRVQETLEDLAGAQFTAKTFRTWNGSLAAFLAMAGGTTTIAALSEAAAHKLHNTPAIARKSYIHPKIVEAAREGHPVKVEGPGRNGLRRGERELLDFLDEN